MDRTEFVKAMIDADETLDIERIKSFHRKNIEDDSNRNFPKGTYGLIIVSEELSELSKEISKHIRGKGNIFDIIQELADAKLSIMHIQQLLDINDETVTKAMNAKMERNINNCTSEGIYT